MACPGREDRSATPVVVVGPTVVNDPVTVESVRLGGPGTAQLLL
jgi:hypothetical protein